MTVKVIKTDGYRDGGTEVYEDELNRRYFLWRPTGKVYNQIPFPRGNLSGYGEPPAYVKEIPVQLEIVDNF